ncbi:MAG: ATPase, T2SS/T4P/T4SS family [Phycisphaerae bacterium]|jgi:type II secretory ATPase GspE/PulE/Tfp pilus assembly ATPase PilB-like protein
MAQPRQHRQYARHAIDLGVDVIVHEDVARQVAPISGHTLRARLVDVSGGGAGLIISTYLPRATRITVTTPAVGKLPPETLPGQVLSVRMIDREPRYAIGVRFADDVHNYAEELALHAPPARTPPPERSATQAAELGPAAPRWMNVLGRAGLVDSHVLSKALTQAAGDEDRAAEWLINNHCLGQRELSAAQAEGYDLAFVEPGEYRVCLDNGSVIREDVARAHGIFPLFVVERIITLAVTRPLDLAVLDQIRLQTGCEVDSCLASPREVHHLIEWAYGSFQEKPGEQAASSELIWTDILKDVADAPVVKLIDVLLDRAASSRASDVHIDPDENALRVRFRIDGVLREVPAPPKSLLPAMISRIKVLAHLDIAETRQPQDGHFKLAVDQEELDIRVSTLPSTGGEAAVLRLLRSGSRLLSLEELGMNAECRQRFDALLHLPHGMLLVTGPTGSGKTTTLYSGITRLDRTRQSIITLEDPVEVRLPQVRQVGVNPKAGLTFESGLRSILRQDPDCIMVGEIRDRETAEIALQAALTGHIVLSTLHTNTAAAAPMRLLDMGVPDFLVASSLIGVLAQRLCRRLCRHCARPAEEPPEGSESVVRVLLGGVQHMEAVGCKRCGNTGFEGRVGVFELLVVTPEIRRAIFARQDDRAMAALAMTQGMRSLLQDGMDKVAAGLTSVTELLRVAGYVEDVAGANRAFARRNHTHRDQPDGAFDVANYERLLGKWLQPSPGSSALVATEEGV